METASEDLSAQMKAAAASHVELARKHFDIALNYSEQSLEAIDESISTFHADGVLSKSTYMSYTSYVGETIRRNTGGDWIESDERGPGIRLDRDGIKASLWVYAWVAKRFEQGEEESISFKYTSAKHKLGLTQDLSTSPPDAEDDDDLIPESLDPENEGSSNNDMQELVARGPAMVFFLVAGADGTIDHKEIKVFRKVVEGVADHKSELFKASVIMMLPSLNEYIEECAESKLGILASLARLREAVDELMPDQAQAYFAALYELAERVAQSSGGGFLGFGSKISKEEQAALSLIRASLGLPNQQSE
ncbi:MAG: hypothetical protein AAGL49_10680 [Pseudomonadota bacterium]